MINRYSLEEKIKHICSQEYKFFLKKANVIGVGLGYKEKGAFRIPKKCISVFVTNKIPENQLSSVDIVPRYYKSIETDVILTEMPKPLSFTQRIRPVPGGYSVGCGNQGFDGTMGCIVTDRKYWHILSSCHVIAEYGAAILGNPIIQPGFGFGGRVGRDNIAYLSKYIPLNPYTTAHPHENLVDCAMAEIHDSSLVDPRVTLLGGIKGTSSPSLNQIVRKVGEVSELSFGKVLSLAVTVLVSYSHQQCLFKNQVRTTYMATGGDSGAVLLDKDMKALGLCMSGTSNETYFNTIHDVLSSLDVQIVFG